MKITIQTKGLDSAFLFMLTRTSLSRRLHWL